MQVFVPIYLARANLHPWLSKIAQKNVNRVRLLCKLEIVRLDCRRITASVLYKRKIFI